MPLGYSVPVRRGRVWVEGRRASLRDRRRIGWQPHALEDGPGRLGLRHYLHEPQPPSAGTGQRVDVVNSLKQDSPINAPRRTVARPHVFVADRFVRRFRCPCQHRRRCLGVRGTVRRRVVMGRLRNRCYRWPSACEQNTPHASSSPNATAAWATWFGSCAVRPAQCQSWKHEQASCAAAVAHRRRRLRARPLTPLAGPRPRRPTARGKA